MKVFIPFSEALLERIGEQLGNPHPEGAAHGLGELVPFQLEYRCLRLGESFTEGDAEALNEPGGGPVRLLA
ncbi:MAG: hypothetical protein R3E86_18220 [Pseudomonadales bacterium]